LPQEVSLAPPLRGESLSERKKNMKGGVKMIPEQFRPQDRRIVTAIEGLRGKGGESYSDVGHRNPIRGDTGPALASIAYLRKPKTMVELGTAYGFSGLHLKLGVPDATLHTVEFDHGVAQEAQKTFDDAGATDVHVFAGTGQEFAKQFTGSIDLVFIDHNKASYLEDFKALEPFLSPDAVIIADNVNDRRAECGDFVDYMFANYPTTQIINTEVGMLVAQRPHRTSGR
jgi:caffeoyl-CoA O-methyltransferase